jgi:hypothetical protein
MGVVVPAGRVALVVVGLELAEVGQVHALVADEQRVGSPVGDGHHGPAVDVAGVVQDDAIAAVAGAAGVGVVGHRVGVGTARPVPGTAGDGHGGSAGGAEEALDRRAHRLDLGGGDVILAAALVDVVLLDVGQDLEAPAAELGRAHGRHADGEVHRRVGPGVAVVGQEAVGIVEVVTGQAELLEVVRAPEAGSRLAHLLDGGQQEADEDGDDRDHDQQLDERETGSRTTGFHERVPRKMRAGEKTR